MYLLNYQHTLPNYNVHHIPRGNTRSGGVVYLFCYGTNKLVEMPEQFIDIIDSANLQQHENMKGIHHKKTRKTPHRAKCIISKHCQTRDTAKPENRSSWYTFVQGIPTRKTTHRAKTVKCIRNTAIHNFQTRESLYCFLLFFLFFLIFYFFIFLFLFYFIYLFIFWGGDISHIHIHM